MKGDETNQTINRIENFAIKGDKAFTNTIYGICAI